MKPFEESHETLTRREFFARSAAALTTTGLLKGMSVTPGKKEIVHRTLGKTKIKIPIVGMGVMNAGNPALLYQSFKQGVRLFDTAKAYGNGENERMVGTFLKQLGKRQEVIIQTKILDPVGVGMGRTRDPLTPGQVKKRFKENFEGSLRRLNTDYVDILFYHAVDSKSRLYDRGVKEALSLVKKEGKARFIGVSTHSNILDDIVESNLFDVVMVQLNFTMAGDTEHLEAIKRAAAKGMGVIAMKTQGGNRMAGGIMNHGAALKWVLRNECITAAIPGYTTSDQLEANVSAAYNLEYTKEEEEFLGDKRIPAAANFCRMCGECRRSCPRNVDIPVLMRVHMYRFGYGNGSRAREMLSTIDKSSGLKNCVACNSCKAYCRNHVNIASNITDLRYYDK